MLQKFKGLDKPLYFEIRCQRLRLRFLETGECNTSGLGQDWLSGSCEVVQSVSALPEGSG